MSIMLRGWWKNFLLLGARSSRVTTSERQRTRRTETKLSFKPRPAPEGLGFSQTHLKGEPAAAKNLQSLHLRILHQSPVRVKGLRMKRKQSDLVWNAGVLSSGVLDSPGIPECCWCTWWQWKWALHWWRSDWTSCWGWSIQDSPVSATDTSGCFRNALPGSAACPCGKRRGGS